MTPSSLIARSLRHHWRTNLAVALGCAAACAVLIGALLVGDSMRGSLRAMTLERLGAIDQAMVSTRFFGQGLAARLAEGGPVAKGDFKPRRVAEAILVQASISGPAGDVASAVNLIGVDKEFFALFSADGLPSSPATKVLINEELATAVGVRAEETKPEKRRLIAQLEKISPIPREAVVGKRSDTVIPVPLAVDAVIATRRAGRFSLDANQRLPKNVYLPIEQLARAIDQPKRANAILLEVSDRMQLADAPAANDLLASKLTLDDYGLKVRVSKQFGYISVESRRQVLEDAVAAAVTEAAKEIGSFAQPTLTYLANTIAIGKREIPYSIVTALDDLDHPPLGPLPVHGVIGLKSANRGDIPHGSLGNNPHGALGDKPKGSQEQILLNDWTIEQLQAKTGDAVRLDYYRVGELGELRTDSHQFTLAGAVAMKGLGLDRDFTPEYPGVTNAKTFADWKPPFHIDTGRLRTVNGVKVDEKYWDDYRTTPKAFVRLADGQRIWATRFGKLTSIRLAPPGGQTVEQFAKTFEGVLLRNLTPAAVGMAFQPVKSLDLAASDGSTDFGQLFLAFSFFLIVSAALLVGLLFRLNIERRAAEVGVLLAVGVSTGRVRLWLLAEGFVVALAGSLVGLVGAFIYARGILAGLTGRWRQAVNTPFIEFHWSLWSIEIGLVASLAVAMVAIVWSVSGLGKTRIPSLLSSGFTFSESRSTGGRTSLRIATISFLLGVSLTLASFTGKLDAMLAFFGGGALLLVSALALLSGILRRPTSGIVRGGGALAIGRLGVRNGGRHPARSVVTAALVAAAVFIIVVIGVLRNETHDDAPRKDSGNGGFALLATSAPIYRDLNDPDFRADLALSRETDNLLAGSFAATAIDQNLTPNPMPTADVLPSGDQASVIYPFRVRGGDDASCLNIYKPREPRLLAPNAAFIERGGFRFAGSLAQTDAEKANPWLLLNRDYGPSVIAAIGDANTLMWILKLNLGDKLALRDQTGQPIELLIVGSLSGSIFQGELLVSEKNLLKAFPDSAGSRFFLLETPDSMSADNRQKLATGLENDLREYGFDVSATAERIAEFKRVENTYMVTLQSLGGLGLVLGTLGLAAVLLRNVLERRSELALLRAVGFTNAALGWLVLAENLFLLLAGVLAGAACALVAVLPQFSRLTDWSPIGPLAGLLLTVVGVGLLSGLFAVGAALRAPILAALRGD